MEKFTRFWRLGLAGLPFKTVAFSSSFQVVHVDRGDLVFLGLDAGLVQGDTTP